MINHAIIRGIVLAMPKDDIKGFSLLSEKEFLKQVKSRPNSDRFSDDEWLNVFNAIKRRNDKINAKKRLR